jgi:hypothetical protein
MNYLEPRKPNEGSIGAANRRPNGSSEPNQKASGRPVQHVETIVLLVVFAWFVRFILVATYVL